MPDQNASSGSPQIPSAQPQNAFLVFIHRRALWIIAAVGVVLLLGLILVAYKHVNEHSVKTAFLTQNALNLLIFIAILVQARIYSGQWNAMQEALAQAKHQNKIAGDALIIGSQAYVCVHSVTLDVDHDRMFIELENLGRVPLSTSKS